jgi:hypothetical protein
VGGTPPIRADMGACAMCSVGRMPGDMGERIVSALAFGVVGGQAEDSPSMDLGLPDEELACMESVDAHCCRHRRGLRWLQTGRRPWERAASLPKSPLAHAAIHASSAEPE